MRRTKVTRIRGLFAVVLLLVVFSACSRHEDVAAPLSIVTPPTPALSVSTGDSLTFVLDWSVSDPTVVNYYRIYTMIPFLGTSMDTTSFVRATVTVSVALPGLQFGVSSVTFQNVESRIAIVPGF